MLLWRLMIGFYLLLKKILLKKNRELDDILILSYYLKKHWITRIPDEKFDMKDLKVAISAPVNDNIYSLLVTYLSISEPGIKVVGVYSLKLWSLKRFLMSSEDWD